MPRLLLVSNRLPVTVRSQRGRIQVSPSAGGLATGLRGPHEQLGGLWFGWPGELPNLPAKQRAEVDRELAKLRTVPIWLTASEIRRYYDGFSNGVLWPLFHYLLDWIPLHSRDWATYQIVNERFADLVAEHYRPGDLIWIQDFHLLLLPDLLRRKIPDATIGFFLHTPFPSYEVFRLIPWRDELLRGMLGANVIGFHTASYLRHFATSVLRVLGIELKVGTFSVEGRDVELRVFPMGIDAADFTERADSPSVLQAVQELKAEHGDVKIILGVDRLDYTKGIPRRLLAYERFLENEPTLREKVKFIQVAVPSRLKVEAYESFRRQVEEMVGRINGAYATLRGAPLHYLFQSFDDAEIVTMYRAADVMIVTPLRDGMNLVAKEYVASRNDDTGVLVLSEFAGASSQLGEAIQVNPYDIDGVAEAIKRAIEMPLEEQRSKMRRLRNRVACEDVHHWASSFIASLERTSMDADRFGRVRKPTSSDSLKDLLRQIQTASQITLLLDYDGTLVPFQAEPEMAVPDKDLRTLLIALSRRPGTTVHVVSGRKREQLEAWLGDLLVGLHADHGLWSRWDREEPWLRLENVDLTWKAQVKPILEEFAERTRGAFVEEKGASLVWHYRQADVEYGLLQAKELRLHLLELLSNYPVQIMAGEKIVEVRSIGVHKGLIISPLIERDGEPSLLVAMGDDRTDEDLFAALPDGGIAIHVGTASTLAGVRLESPEHARRFLAELAGFPRDGANRGSLDSTQAAP